MLPVGDAGDLIREAENVTRNSSGEARITMLLYASVLLPTQVQAVDFGGAAAVTSDYVFRGLSQSDGETALQADLHLTGVTGWIAGVWASKSREQPGYYASLEIDAYLGHFWELRDPWSARITYLRYTYPEGRRYLDYDYDELVASLAYSDRIALNVAWSPDATQISTRGIAENRRMFSYEATVRQPVWGPFALTASAGYYDLHDLFGEHYWAWSGGMEWQLRQLTLAFTYFGVDARGRELFYGRAADGKSAATAIWRF